MAEQVSTPTKKDVRPRNPLRAWFDVRKDSVNSWAFALNRLTGIGLTVYLFLHLAVLSTLRGGETAWNDFVALAKTPAFLMLDVVLLFGVLFHGLNGVRVALVGSGIGYRRQLTLFWTLMGIGAVLLIVGAVLIFTK